MQSRFWRLQLFADGGGNGAASGGEGAAASGVTPADAGQGTQERTLADVLRERGVPEDRLQRRAYQRKVQTAGTPAGQEQAQAAVAGQNAETNASPQQQEQKAERMSWEQIMADPEYNAKMQETVQKRVSKLKGADDAMKALSPALEMMAKRYGVDANDYSALSNAMLDDDAFYQQRALDMGVSVDVAKRLDQAERLEQARQRDEELSEQERQIREHLAGLYQQAEALKQRFPDFDLDREMQNRDFVYMTQPGSGLSVEDAYFAIHRQELMESAKQSAQRAMASTIASGQMRPNETGTKKAGSAPAARPNMSKEHREELKQRFRNGERITTEMMY